MTSLKFSIANNAVTHLGRNLYSTTPPALAELVANSYDAYATAVNINLSNESISIIDNGKGLSIKELETKYAIIGSEKQKEVPFNNLTERKPMGKKGIGKLAAFSLGDVYTVYSKSVGQTGWLTFTLNYKEMTSKNDYDVEVKKTELPEEFLEYKQYSSGFIVKITSTRRKITAATKDNIKKQLSRRFYIDHSKTQFDLKIDGKKLSLDANEYYDKIEYLVYFGKEEDFTLKSKFLEENFPKSYFIPINSKKYPDKAHVNMKDSILIDDEERHLFSCNAKDSICFGETYPWNENWKGKRMDWKEISEYLL